jgi:two-component system sensor histidine kinase/response regulator
MIFSNAKKLNIAFASAWAVMLVLGITSYLGLQKSVSDAAWVTHTGQVMNQISMVQSSINEMDSSVISYTLTGRESFLNSYRAAETNLSKQLEQLAQLVEDNPVQHDHAKFLVTMIERKKAFTQQIFEMKRSGRDQKDEEVQITNDSDGTTKSIDSVTEEMMQNEEKIQSKRIISTTRSNQFAALMIALGTLASCFLVWVAKRAINSDLDSREKADLALKESQERFHLVSKATQDSVWDWNLTTNQLWWNDGINIHFGFEADKLYSGTWWIEKIHPGDRERILNMIHMAIEGGTESHWQGEYRFRKSDGTYRVVYDRGFLSRNAEGRAIRMIGSMMDMTEQKQLQNELIEAREKAIVSSKLKSEFLANMSHEIRTPMNGVIGMTGMLLDTDLTVVQKDYAETIRGCADSLLTVINDILDFSKIEAGKLIIDATDFELRNVVESCMELLAPEAHAKNLELICSINPELPHSVKGDAGRIRQMVTNLLGNALKFTHEGEILVEVSVREKADGVSDILFEIVDSGIGITDENQARLFKAFIQADGSTNRKYGGTGLGLAISKQLVELMGGDMGVRSVFGKGSTFWFTLPLIPSEIQWQRPVKEFSDLKGRRCIVIDDNATNRRILAHQLNTWGMESMCYATPGEGLKGLRLAIEEGHAIDLVILDMHMPEMSGVEFAKFIKGNDALSKTKLILMSSMSQAATAAELSEAQISVFLMKPVRQSHLYNCCLELLSNKTSSFSTPIDSKASNATRQIIKRNARVLIAEDNPINQRIALSQLEKLGFAAEVVSNGLLALEATAMVSYDLILMDCQMPEMDGYEATRLIRQREGQDKHTTIIAMTANAVEGDREKCINAGMDDYIGKPVNVAALKKLLDHWVPDSQSVS